MSASDAAAIQAKIQTLATEKEGNAVASAFLARLASVGEQGSLKLSDFSVTTTPTEDFKGKVSDADLAHLGSSTVKAFNIVIGGQIYLTQSSIYYGTIDSFKDALERKQLADVGGAITAHERNHREGGGEPAASAEGGRVFQKFKKDFTSGSFNNWLHSIAPGDH